MASTASIASSSRSEQASTGPTSQPQAGPLPRKRGELGFQEGVHALASTSSIPGAPITPLPSQHPAERGTSVEQPQHNTSAPSNPSIHPGSSADPDTTSMHTAGKRSVIARLKPKRIIGFYITTLLRAIFQFLLLGGTIASWALVVVALNRQAAQRRADGGSNLSPFDITIFVHVAFTVVTLGQIVFLERVIFLLRAERYGHLHPGAELPTLRQRLRGGADPPASTDTALAFAPWNRPAVPTYAAALIESGYGTGDVEDNAIAIPPPPAYGQTRGSTMLLSGFMNDSLRAQARAARDSIGSMKTMASDRPISYLSQRSDQDERSDMSQAGHVGDALARLEEGQRATKRQV